MPWFVKSERFTAAAAALPIEQRRPTLEAHRDWVSGEAVPVVDCAAAFWWMQIADPGAVVC